MTTVSPTNAPVVDFDHHSDDFASNLETIVRDMRSCPVAYTNNNGGHFIVSTHALAKQVLRDVETFKSSREADGSGGLFIPTFPIPFPGGALLPAECDPPYHTQLRRSLDKYFNRPATEQLRPRIVEIVTGVFDRVVTMGEFDVVHDVGHLVGPTMMMGYIGFPLEFRHTFIDAIRTGFQRKVDDNDVSFLYEMATQAMGVIQDKRKNPGDDVASKLMEALPDIDDVGMLSFLILLLFAGFETTEAMITNSLWYLDEHRELREELRRDRTLIPGALDEFLRLAAPETTTVRTVTRDVELGGVRLTAGDRVLVLLASGNLDETVFPDADRIDIRRNCGQSLTFGHGIHHCPGNHLTKIEAEEILNQVLDRIPDYSIDRENSRRFTDRAAANGWITMPARTNL
ncbi:MAG TPA: cytochrome P450 [Pseudonocardia sp.]